MNTPYAWNNTTARVGSAVFDEGLRQHMLRVYNFMGLGLIVTGLVAFVVASTPALYVPITAAMFGATSLWGYTTRRNLAAMGSFLIMGLIGIIIASLVNLFIGSSVLQFAVSIIGVLVFTGLTAYDTQSIKEQYAEGLGTEANSKLAVLGALSLYLNFINLFQLLLSLTGQREE
jgi:FtsH-binding integral membrane protein